jgi:hypothetical protein
MTDMGGPYKIVPDEEDHEAAKADTSYAAANDVERYRLAQAAKLIRINRYMEEKRGLVQLAPNEEA